MPVRQRGETWQADVQHEGRRYRAAFRTQADALRWETEARIALAAGRAVPQASSQAGASLPSEATLSTLQRTLLTTPPPLGWHGTKAEDWASRASGFALRFFGENARPSDITTERVEEYVAWLREQRNANATINRKLAALSKMLRYARRKGWVKELPLLDRQRESQGRLRWLTWAEQDRLVGALRVEGQHLAADLVEFLADTGFRVREALTLPIGAADDRMVHLADPDKIKNGNARAVPQTERVRALVQKRRAELGECPDETLMWPLAYSTLRSMFDRAKERAKLGGDVTIHTLRHTCASRLVQGGVDIRRVKDWMGHKSLVVTMRYAHLAPEHLYEAAAALARDAKPELRVVAGTARS